MAGIEITKQPRKEFCDKNNIETLFGIGGNNKSNSSSWILKNGKNRDQGYSFFISHLLLIKL